MPRNSKVKLSSISDIKKILLSYRTFRSVALENYRFMRIVTSLRQEGTCKFCTLNVKFTFPTSFPFSECPGKAIICKEHNI